MLLCTMHIKVNTERVVNVCWQRQVKDCGWEQERRKHAVLYGLLGKNSMPLVRKMGESHVLAKM